MGIVEKFLAGGFFLIAAYLVLSRPGADTAILKQGGSTSVSVIQAFQGR